MTSKPVHFHHEATTDYETALHWYFERNEVVAFKFWEEIDQAVNKISATPQRWAKHISGARRLLLHRFPYAVVYRELPDSIQIVAVAHLSRRPGYWISRIQANEY